MGALKVLKRWCIALVPLFLGGVTLTITVLHSDRAGMNSFAVWISTIALMVVAIFAPLLSVMASVSPPPRVILGDSGSGAERWWSPVRATAVGGTIACAAAILCAIDQWGGYVALALAFGAMFYVGVTALVVVRAERRRSRARALVREQLKRRGPGAVLYVGRVDGGRYQVEKWLDLLAHVHGPLVIAVRSQIAARALSDLASSSVAIAMLPRAEDLDLLPFDSLQVVYYPGSSAVNTNMVSFRQVKHVYLGHGDSDKEISTHPSHRMYDRVFVAGQAAADRYAAAGLSLPQGSLVTIGRPALEQIRPTPASAPERVLYAPTWGGYNQASSLSSLKHGRWVVSELMSRGVQVTFRPHPLSLTSGKEARLVKDIDRLLDGGGGHLTSAQTSGSSIESLMAASDALITDVSSMLIEYLPYGGRLGLVVAEGFDVAPYPSAAVATPLRTPDDVALWLRHDAHADVRAKAANYYVSTTGTEDFVSAVTQLTEGPGA